jgi:hypothetical protein
MDNVQDHAASRPLESLADQMHDKEYRDQYVESFNRQLVARQMRGFRGDMTQTEYAPTIDKTQTQVARFEDPTYGWQTRTVFEIARKQNVAAIICFVDFETFLRFEGNMSEDMVAPRPYDKAAVDAFVDRYETGTKKIPQKGVTTQNIVEFSQGPNTGIKVSAPRNDNFFVLTAPPAARG